MIADFDQLNRDLAENRARQDNANISLLTKTIQLDAEYLNLVLDINFELVSFTETNTMSISINQIIYMDKIIGYKLGNTMMNHIQMKLFELLQKRTKVS